MARHEPTPAARIARVRALRVRARDDALAPAIERLKHDLARQHARVGGVAEAWSRLVPESVGKDAVLAGMARGVLTVRVRSAPARFVLDRWLRAGGEDVLRGATRAGLRRVRVVVGRSQQSGPLP